MTKEEFDEILERVNAIIISCELYEKLIQRITPRKVRFEGNGYADGRMVYDYAYCPHCDHETEIDSENWESEFCPECGQRLDWSVEE